MKVETKKENVAILLKKGVLISPDYVEEVDPEISPASDVLILNKDTHKLLSKNEKGINWKELDKVHVLYEKGRSPLPSVEELSSISEQHNDIEILASYKSNPQKITVSHFVKYFNTRYKLIERLLRSRPELQNLTSIKRIKDRAVTNNLSLIGMINEKRETKNKNIMITLEDSTGSHRILINKNRPDLFKEAQDLVPDAVIGITGSYREGIVFVNNIVLPDIPSLDMKHSPDEEYLACMSDLHFGSKQFMPDEFNRFLSWVNQESGNDKQKNIAAKLKYIIIAGDIVDGVGIYQNQYSELTIKDVRKQYDECAKSLAQIPEHIKIIISPGNHDAVRMSEPQPPFNTYFAEPLTKLKNALLVSNPAAVRIGIKENFSGFNCLIYHGYSFDHYVANVDSIRLNGGYERADLIMKFLLRSRHLAPTHTSTLINPTPDYDALFIDPVPDFFITGHIHRTSISNYKVTTLVNSSCWQSMTSFQERLGHSPQPARLPLINLKTRDATIINFGK